MSNATIIEITGQQMLDMGWVIGDDSPETNFLLWIDLQEQKIQLSSTPSDSGFLDYSFDYTETLQDLYSADLLPHGIAGGNCLYYNERVNKYSECIQHAAVGGICDMSMIEVAALKNLGQLNNIITAEFSITREPIFDLIEE